MQQKVIQVGNSLAIVIPQKLAKQYGIKKGAVIHIVPDATSESFRISPSQKAKDGLTPEFFAWKKEFFAKNYELFKKLAKFDGTHN